MTYLPETRQALQDAAARRYGPPQRRRLHFPGVRPLVPLVLACGLAASLLAINWPDQAGPPEAVVTAVPEPSGIPPARDVPQTTLALSAELASRPPARPLQPPTAAPVPHAELAQVAAGFQTVTPYPPGGEDRFAWDRTPADPLQAGSITSRWEIQRLVEHRASCIWLQFWLAAEAQRATAPQQSAATVLRDVSTWPTVPSSGASDRWKHTAAAAARGDARTVSESSTYCRDVTSPWNP
jgi:hypothetical protein